MQACQQPIIGAINGFAITGGFEIALMCDFLIASTEAKFADTHARPGRGSARLGALAATSEVNWYQSRERTLIDR